MVDIGLKFLSAPILYWGITLGSRSQNFHKKVKIFVFMFIKLSHQGPLRNFIYILHIGRYRSRVVLSMSPIPGYDLEVKVKDLEISYKSQKICI